MNLCTECKYSHKVNYSGRRSGSYVVCNHPNNLGPVGNYRRFSCDALRKFSDECGAEGKWFEKSLTKDAESPTNKEVELKFEYGDLVEYDNGVMKGLGIVCGVASAELPIIGRMYSICDQSRNVPNERYPFRVFSCAECHLKLYENGKGIRAEINYSLYPKM